MKNLITIGLLLSITITGFTQEFYEPVKIFDTIKFERPCAYLYLDSSEQNLWQTGNPSKGFFDSSYSPTHAAVTDTLNSYPVNNHSFFDLVIGTFNLESFYYNIFLSMKHKFDTDSLKDGGYITVSWDKGKSWLNIIEDTAFINYFGPTPAEVNRHLYSRENTLYNGEPGYSGKSDGWISTMFGWYIPPVKSTRFDDPDTMIIRFNFISDDIDNSHDGWMIDDICLYEAYVGTGAIKDASLQEKITVSPNPVITTAVIDLGNNYREISLQIFDNEGKIVDLLHYSNACKVEIDCKNLATGNYYINILLDNNITTVKKIVVKKNQ